MRLSVFLDVIARGERCLEIFQQCRVDLRGLINYVLRVDSESEGSRLLFFVGETARKVLHLPFGLSDAKTGTQTVRGEWMGTGWVQSRCGV